MSEEDKANQYIIEAVFYDDEYGHGSKINTLRYARQVHKNITMDDIDKFMNQVTFRTRKGYSNYHLLLIFHARNTWWM